MRSSTHARMRLFGAGCAILVGLTLTSCDQREERVDRAKTLSEAAMDQINGRTIVEPKGPSALETASVQDRAVAGTIRNDLNFRSAAASSRFAVGSIIAKPKDIPPAPMALSVDEIEALEAVTDGRADPAILEEPALVEPADAMPVIELDPSAPAESRSSIEEAANELRRDELPRTRGLGGRRAPITAAPGDAPAPVAEAPSTRSMRSLPAPQRSEVKRAARRSIITEEAIAKQTDAQTVMLDRMSKYGLGGNVALSRSGQMVIQIGAEGADPTRFSPQDAGGGQGGNAVGVPGIANGLEDGCPDPESISPAAMQANPVLATECFVEDLRRTGQFEYVEKDYIFDNQMIRRGERAGPDAPDTGTDTGTDTPPDNSVTPTPTVTDVTPNDPLYALQWHFQNNGTGEGESPGGAGFQDFWSRQAEQGSSEIVVAVVDTGLQMNHPDILNSPNIAPGWDMVSDPDMGNDGGGRDSDPNDPGDLCDPNEPYAEDSFHGTHVAGTVGAAATNNGSGVAGGAWNVKIVPVRALGKCGGRLSDINDAIRWAAGTIPADDENGNEIFNENPADIINLSIGLFNFCPASLQEAIDEVTERGAIVVAAAGNARVATRFYAPGGCNNVISVAAGDARGQITPYSNYGSEVDILAPGGDLFRDDNNDGRPDGVLSTKNATNCYDPVTGEGVDNCFYAYEQGTSMAAPHVSAALALLKAREPSASPERLEALLLNSLDPRNSLQCAGSCAEYPGAEPIEGTTDMCARPCGGGLLNLGNIAALDSAPD